MADHQKIYPVGDPEAPTPPSAHPTAPLVPRGSSRSDHGDPGKESPAISPPLPPLRRSVPYQPLPPPKRKRSCCCRCMCYTLCLLLLLLVAVGATIGILYLVFKPKIPDYSIDRLELTRFALDRDSRLSATFNVSVIATNPNKKIGIYYENGSKISVWYSQTKLSEGSLPKFYQGHENTTVLYVEMIGQTEDAAGLMMTLQEQQQQTGNIPLRVRVNQPVRVKLGRLKLMKVRFLVRCEVSVDSLAPNTDVRIEGSSCKIRLRL